MKTLIQLNRQLHYLLVALLFASFAVAQSVQAGSNQRMIQFDYTTGPILGAFNEQVELHGTIRISFKKKGTKGPLATGSLENFEGVGLTTKREYVADTVTVEITRISRMAPVFRLLLPSDIDFIANLHIPVTGKHPTDLNSATGDPLPGQDVHFGLVYSIGWRWGRDGKVAGFIPLQADGKGVITGN